MVLTAYCQNVFFHTKDTRGTFSTCLKTWFSQDGDSKMSNSRIEQLFSLCPNLTNLTKCPLPARGPLWGEVMVPVWSTPPKRASSGVLVGAWWCCPGWPRLPVPTAGLLLGVCVCWEGPRWWKRPLSEPVPMVPSRLMERWPGSLGLLLPAPMCRPGTRARDEYDWDTLIPRGWEQGVSCIVNIFVWLPKKTEMISRLWQNNICQLFVIYYMITSICVFSKAYF